MYSKYKHTKHCLQCCKVALEDDIKVGYDNIKIQISRIQVKYMV